MAKIIQITNFDKYQHYKGEHMIWVKLYVKLLHDVNFMLISVENRWVFIGLLLLAAECENSIKYNPEFLERLLNTKNIGKSLQVLNSINLIVLTYKKSIPISIDNIKKIREEKKREEESIREKIHSSLNKT